MNSASLKDLQKTTTDSNSRFRHTELIPVVKQCGPYRTRWREINGGVLEKIGTARDVSVVLVNNGRTHSCSALVHAPYCNWHANASHWMSYDVVNAIVTDIIGVLLSIEWKLAITTKQRSPYPACQWVLVHSRRAKVNSVSTHWVPYQHILPSPNLTCFRPRPTLISLFNNRYQLFHIEDVCYSQTLSVGSLCNYSWPDNNRVATVGG